MRIVADESEVVRELASKYNLDVQMHDFGKWRFGDVQDPMGGVAELCIREGWCGIYDGDKHLKRISSFLDDLHRMLGVRIGNIMQHNCPTGFLTCNVAHRESRRRVLRLRDLFSSHHEYRCDKCGRVFELKYKSDG